MNARPDWADVAERAHLRQMDAESKRDDGEAEITNEISSAMHRNLCLGEDVKVPSWKAGNPMKFADDEEVDKPALEILWFHLTDDKAEPLLLALLRTNTPEARALVEYAAARHAWFNASDINDIREREAMEP